MLHLLPPTLTLYYTSTFVDGQSWLSLENHIASSDTSICYLVLSYYSADTFAKAASQLHVWIHWRERILSLTNSSAYTSILIRYIPQSSIYSDSASDATAQLCVWNFGGKVACHWPILAHLPICHSSILHYLHLPLPLPQIMSLNCMSILLAVKVPLLWQF